MCIRDSNGWVSSAGSWVTQFENLICKYTNAKYAVAMTNGTDALRLALHVMGVRSGDEVIMSPISFIATANAISHLGAKPYFVDIERNSLGISPTALQKELNLIGIKRGQTVFNKISGRRISAILPVHVFGHPSEVLKIKAIAEELRGLAVETNVPIMSATQTTRSGFSSSDIGLEDTSESFGLPATADLMFALISTEELEDLNQIMVKQLKKYHLVFYRCLIRMESNYLKLKVTEPQLD